MRKQDRIWKYLKGKQTGKEANRLEREALSDPFLYEALEGLERVEGDHEKVVCRLYDSIQKAGKRKRRISIGYFLSWAAACLLFAGTAIWLLYMPEKTVEETAQMMNLTDTIEREGVLLETAKAEIKQKKVCPKAQLTVNKKDKLMPLKMVVKDREASVPEASGVGKEEQKFRQSFLQTSVPEEKPVKGRNAEEQVAGEVVDTNGLPLLSSVSESVVNGPVTKRRNPKNRIKVDFIEEQDKFKQYVADSLRYPEDARLRQIEGEVVLSVHLNKRKRPSQIKVVHKLFPSCDHEAIRLVEEYKGNWGTKASDFMVTIRFDLKDGKSL